MASLLRTGFLALVLSSGCVAISSASSCTVPARTQVLMASSPGDTNVNNKYASIVSSGRGNANKNYQYVKFDQTKASSASVFSLSPEGYLQGTYGGNTVFAQRGSSQDIRYWSMSTQAYINDPSNSLSQITCTADSNGVLSCSSYSTTTGTSTRPQSCIGNGDDGYLEFGNRIGNTCFEDKLTLVDITPPNTCSTATSSTSTASSTITTDASTTTTAASTTSTDVSTTTTAATTTTSSSDPCSSPDPPTPTYIFKAESSDRNVDGNYASVVSDTGAGYYYIFFKTGQNSATSFQLNADGSVQAGVLFWERNFGSQTVDYIGLASDLSQYDEANCYIDVSGYLQCTAGLSSIFQACPNDPSNNDYAEGYLQIGSVLRAGCKPVALKAINIAVACTSSSTTDLGTSTTTDASTSTTTSSTSTTDASTTTTDASTTTTDASTTTTDASTTTTDASTTTTDASTTTTDASTSTTDASTTTTDASTTTTDASTTTTDASTTTTDASTSTTDASTTTTDASTTTTDASTSTTSASTSSTDSTTTTTDASTTTTDASTSTTSASTSSTDSTTTTTSASTTDSSSTTTSGSSTSSITSTSTSDSTQSTSTTSTSNSITSQSTTAHGSTSASGSLSSTPSITPYQPGSPASSTFPHPHHSISRNHTRHSKCSRHPRHSSTTSTVYSTHTYTISSCASTVTNCPYGSVTTDIIPLYTTVCPVTVSKHPHPSSSVINTYKTGLYGSTTSTIYATTVYTITSCAKTVTNCPIGSVTTETVALYTTVCPVSSSDIVSTTVTVAPVASEIYKPSVIVPADSASVAPTPASVAAGSESSSPAGLASSSDVPSSFSTVTNTPVEPTGSTLPVAVSPTVSVATSSPSTSPILTPNSGDRVYGNVILTLLGAVAVALL